MADRVPVDIEKVFGERRVTVAPSLLSADFTSLRSEMKRFVGCGARVLHLDVMDGNFVPNITFGYSLVGRLRPLAPDTVFDVHLMMTHPLAYIEKFARAGADMITVHKECRDDIGECLDAIHSFGLRAGISIKPDTRPHTIYKYLDRTDLVLIMTVYPGFGGQTMIFKCLDKIPLLRKNSPSDELLISVDGGVNKDTCERVADAGANILVAGNAVFGAKQMPAAYRALTERIGG